MTAIDDLNVGDLIAVVCNLNSDEDCDDGFTGIPLKILAISLPFLACMRGDGTTCAIDVRAWGITRVSADYFFAMNSIVAELVPAEEPKKEDDDRVCQRCGDRLAQTLVLKPEGREWCEFCRNCRWVGIPVPCQP